MGNINKKIPEINEDVDNTDIPTGQPQDLISPIATRQNPTRSARIENKNMEQKHMTDSDTNSDDDTEYKTDDKTDDKPITFKINKIDSERNNKYNPFMTDMRIYSGHTTDDIKHSNDDMKQQQQNKSNIGSFQFGELFGYWDPKSSTKTYINPQHKSLKDEVTNSKNDIYINDETWIEFMKIAKHKYKTMYSNNKDTYAIYAKNKPYFNQLFGIKHGSKMSIEHILSVILYTDTDDLQKYFKQQTRKMNCNETVESVVMKNSKYANWFRLLFEVIWLFGDELACNKKVYHGINCQLLFDKFQYDIKAPLSTTFDVNVAGNFGSDNGIILELRNGESAPQPYFDVTSFSRYPESEYLFFGATLKISSIMMADPNGSTYVNYEKSIQVLNFYMNIMNGNEIERYSLMHCNNNKKHIKLLRIVCKKTLKLIKQHIKLLKGDNKAGFEGDYVWELFVNFTRVNHIIWINKNKLKYLKENIKCKKNENIELVDTFIRNDELGPYVKLLLNTNPKMKVSYAVEWEWNIQEQDLNKLKTGQTEKNGIVCFDYWDYYFGKKNDKNNMCSFGGNMVADYFENRKQTDEIKKVGFYWRLSDITKQYKSVMVSVELYCPQIEFYIQFFNVEMAKNGGLDNTGHTSLFPITLLDDLDTFTWRIIMKCTPIYND